MKMWQMSDETMSVSEIKQLQLERLQSTLNRVYNNVEFYHNLFNKLNITPEKIKSLDDIKHLPFTTKQDLRDNYPYGMFAVPLKDIVRIHSSSGTTGKPTVVGYTKRDLELWKNLVARIMVAGGVTKDDIVHIAFTYGLFTGGFGLHYGAEHIGASVIPVSSGNTRRQIMIMQDYRSSVLICTPSYALHIAETLESMGLTKDDIHLKYGLFGSEPWGEKIRSEIENRLGIIATDNYGLSEIIGPGVAGECLYKNGLHINEDHFYVEVIDPETGEVLPEGEKGELVITTLSKEAMPLIRYRTRDITRIYRDNCKCGRTLIKMEKPSGRTDDMIIVNGVNVFPSQVEEALKEIEDTTPHFMIYVRKKGALDMMEIHLEVSENLFFDEMKRQKEVLDKITEKLFNYLGIKPKVKLVEPKSLERFEGKAKRVIDERQQ
ncbi:phenylacetate-CoA ligase [Deferribacter desulfuricans SSM1]|uniref:Phenylacetate-coenzyme A ligase n=1 Tax=Deferribacter desulfuricans (strain DSM 14783 / JCM 11476 / NBRC 101012 / SSM1) TaxID=639282 RepID=D3PCV6_DEFDS|nr:phenylacetate--CoA ligase [Deferribacter desulfuricans]BAI80429.1 phenylacetate-CoA ligase [Deferribacter desulfuricans SSM1]